MIPVLLLEICRKRIENTLTYTWSESTSIGQRNSNKTVGERRSYKTHGECHGTQEEGTRG